MPKKINSHTETLLALLNDGHFHDGNELGEQLGISRTAVWKIVKKLMEYGIDIEAIKKKGYCLKEPLILLNARKIKSALEKKLAESVDLHVFECVDSTNDAVKLPRLKKLITICLAETQTAGRGRLGRQWNSPFARNVYFSLRYQLHKDMSELSGLSLVVGLSIAEALKTAGFKQNFRVKWPNDILLDGKKIAGTLIEVIAETHGVCDIVIGIGINVNTAVTPSKLIAQPWTSLQAITQKTQDRNQLVSALITQLTTDLSRFQNKGFPPFIAEWNEKDALMNQAITVINGSREYSGTAKGVNQHGYLQLKMADGKTLSLSSGDTSIRK